MQFKFRLTHRSPRSFLSSALLTVVILGTAAPASADLPTELRAGTAGASAAPGPPISHAIYRGNGAQEGERERRALPGISARKASPALGKQLATRFFRLLVRKDRSGLKEFLAKGWQIQRSDGTGSTGRKAYLRELGSINVKRFRLTRFRVTRADRVLIVRYRSQVTESVNESPLTQSEAPRLSTFLLHDGRWRMTSHANFAPLPR